MDKSNFFTGLQVQESDLDQIYTDVEEAIDDTYQRFLRTQGIVVGGQLVEETPSSKYVKFPYITALTSSGKRIRFEATSDTSTWIRLDLTRDGYSEVGPSLGSTVQCDGADISPATGKQRWVSVYVYHATLQSDQRSGANFKTHLFRAEDSFKIRIVAGDEHDAGTDWTLKRPAVIDDTGDWVLIGDALLLNSSGTIKTTGDESGYVGSGVSHQRNSAFEHRFESVFTRGCPAVVTKHRLAYDPSTEDVDGAQNVDTPEFVGGSGPWDTSFADFGSFVHFTRKGKFLWSEDANDSIGAGPPGTELRRSIRFTFPVFNTSNSTITKSIEIWADDQLYVALAMVPNTDVFSAAYGFAERVLANSTGLGGTVSAVPGGTTNEGDPFIYTRNFTFPPGRSLVRMFATCAWGNRLLLGCNTEWYDAYDGLYLWRSDRRNKIIHDRRQMESILHYGAYLGFDINEFGGITPALT